MGTDHTFTFNTTIATSIAEKCLYVCVTTNIYQQILSWQLIYCLPTCAHVVCIFEGIKYADYQLFCITNVTVNVDTTDSFTVLIDIHSLNLAKNKYAEYELLFITNGN